MSVGRLAKGVLVLGLAALLATGCFNSRRSKATAIVGGLAIAAAGGALYAGIKSDEGEGPGEELACISMCPVAYTLIGVGAVLAAVGIVSPPEEEPAPPPQLVAPGATTPATATDLRIPPAVQRPLPEIATDELTLQMAKQVRGAAIAGNCETAHHVLEKIEGRDARYHAALVASTVPDGCR